MSAQTAAALGAIRAGIRTSRELASTLGISRPHASVVLYNLRQARLVQVVDRLPNGKGPPTHVYEAAPARSVSPSA